jgi:hypothetical protein
MPKTPPEKLYKGRKKFSGYVAEYDATAIVGKHITDDGLTYYKRRDGLLYPKHTSISVTESTRRLCAILREAGHYNNYDELILDIAQQIVDAESDPMLKRAVVQVKIDIGLRKSARKKAIDKQRYHRRKSKMN